MCILVSSVFKTVISNRGSVRRWSRFRRAMRRRAGVPRLDSSHSSTSPPPMGDKSPAFFLQQESGASAPLSPTDGERDVREFQKYNLPNSAHPR